MKKICRLISLTLTVIVALGVFVNVSAVEQRNHIQAMNEWAQPYVKRATDLGWLNEDIFSGDLQRDITREEFCILAYNAVLGQFCVDSIISNPFSDTENTDAILQLYALGIISGKSSTEFAPTDSITREEAATILYRMCKLLKINDVYEDYRLSSFLFVDEESFSDWAKESIYNIYLHGIMQGVGEDLFDPQSTYSMEQAIATMVRLYEKYEESDITVDDEIVENSTLTDRINAQMPADKNYMFSPLSIKMAFAMVANGAEGETKKEILDALDITDLEDFNQFSKELIAKYSQTESLKLNIANSIWINSDKTKQKFSDSFHKTAKEYYDADSKTVHKANAIKEINAWASDKTNQKITQIVQNADFWTMLVNAIYFKAVWEEEFYERATKPAIFQNADGTKTETDFMNKTDYFRYAKVTGGQMLELPYRNYFDKYSADGEYLESECYEDLNVSMYVMLCDENVSPVTALASALSGKKFSSEYVRFSLPKFVIEFETELNDILKNIGINKAFESDADFRKMFDSGNMQLTDTVHKTYINVDEKGTEAAAVTSVLMAGSALPPEPVELKFDRPFYFIIRDNKSGETLFMGRVAEL